MLWNTGESMFLHLFLMSFLFFCIIYFFYIKISLHPWIETCGSMHIYAHTCSLHAWILESPGALQVAVCFLTVIAFPASDLIQLTPAFSAPPQVTGLWLQKLSGLSVITTVSSALSLGFYFSFSWFSPLLHGTCPCGNSLIGLLEPWLTSPNSELPDQPANWRWYWV